MAIEGKTAEEMVMPVKAVEAVVVYRELQLVVEKEVLIVMEEVLPLAMTKAAEKEVVVVEVAVVVEEEAAGVAKVAVAT